MPSTTLSFSWATSFICLCMAVQVHSQKNYSDAIQYGKFARHYQALGDVMAEENRLKEHENRNISPRFSTSYTDSPIGAPNQKIFDYTESRKIQKETTQKQPQHEQLQQQQLQQKQQQQQQKQQQQQLLQPESDSISANSQSSDQRGEGVARIGTKEGVARIGTEEGVARRIGLTNSLSIYPQPIDYYPPSASLYPPAPPAYYTSSYSFLPSSFSPSVSYPISSSTSSISYPTSFNSLKFPSTSSSMYSIIL